MPVMGRETCRMWWKEFRSVRGRLSRLVINIQAQERSARNIYFLSFKTFLHLHTSDIFLVLWAKTYAEWKSNRRESIIRVFCHLTEVAEQQNCLATALSVKQITRCIWAFQRGDYEKGSVCYLLHIGFLLSLFFCLEERHVPPKRRFTFNGVHIVIFQKTELLMLISHGSHERFTVQLSHEFYFCNYHNIFVKTIRWKFYINCTKNNNQNSKQSITS
jgi:hypothetical protein